MSESEPEQVGRFGKARRIRGIQLVRGGGNFGDDAAPEGALHARFVRSRVAHARLRQVDVAEAKEIKGVRGVWTGADIEAAGLGRLQCRPPAALTGTSERLELDLLPTRHIRYWGEALALVVASTQTAADAGAAAVAVSWDELEPLASIDAALKSEARVQHDDLQSNVLTDVTVSGGSADDALANAPLTASGHVGIGRSSAVPLEPRVCIAAWDRLAQRLHVRAATQLPHTLRTDLSRILSMRETDIHVVAPDLGGAFGFKFPGLPEEILVAFAARQLESTVRWVESRAEALLVGAREYNALWKVGFDSDGRVHGFTVDLQADVGALAATPGVIMPTVAASTFPSGYDISDFAVRARTVLTNKGPWNGARGFGKEATCVVMETIMDQVAHQTGIDPVQVRMNNLVQADAFPYRTPTMTLDSGDYQRAVKEVLDLSGYEDLRRSSQSGGAGQRTGVGLAFELSPEGLDAAGTLSRGHESATVRLDMSGHVTVLTGVTSPGSGSETAIAQVVAERLGVEASRVQVIQGDTDSTPYGGGSFSSRAVLVGATAAWMAADELRTRLSAVVARVFGCAPGDIEFLEGAVRSGGDVGRSLTLKEAIQYARSFGGAVAGIPIVELEATKTYAPGNLQSIPDESGRLQQYPTYAYAVCIAEVNVDEKTGIVHVVSLSVVHDCGVVINDDLVHGQIQGAIAMGLGMALTEEETYDTQLRPQSFDFKRYLLPRAPDMPEVRIGSVESPSPFSALGTKGAGESAVGGAAAAIAAAVRDAIGLEPRHAHVLPLTPERILELIDIARSAAR